MTTNVPKGANRASATASRNRHAQRTPLPPKPGQVEAAKEAIEATTQQPRPRKPAAQAKIVKVDGATMRIRAATAAANQRANFEDAMSLERAVPQYGRKTLAQLRDYAKKLGVKPIPGKKGDLLNALLAKAKELDAIEHKAAELEAEKSAKAPKLTVVPARGQGATKPTPEPAPEPAKPQKVARKAAQGAVEPRSGSSVSESKAVAFETASATLGWATVRATDGDTTSVEAKRGDERIFIEWVGGVFQGDSCVYTLGTRTIKLRNASAAKQQMAKSPEVAAAETAKAATVRRPGVTKADRAKAPRKLPFTEASLDQEVIDALYGKRITWISRITNTEDTDVIPPINGTGEKLHHQPHITEGPHGRVLNFLGAAGFRSVLVSQIKEVR